jgi:hypothetical protein
MVCGVLWNETFLNEGRKLSEEKATFNLNKRRLNGEIQQGLHARRTVVIILLSRWPHTVTMKMRLSQNNKKLESGSHILCYYCIHIRYVHSWSSLSLCQFNWTKKHLGNDQFGHLCNCMVSNVCTDYSVVLNDITKIHVFLEWAQEWAQDYQQQQAVKLLSGLCHKPVEFSRRQLWVSSQFGTSLTGLVASFGISVFHCCSSFGRWVESTSTYMPI